MKATSESSQPNTRATHARYWVLAMLCGLSMITYLDRVCFGVAANSIVSELSLQSVADLKWAFTAFAVAYAIFEIPCGWLGDRLGPRSTLIRIVLWWSACTAMTGLIGLHVGPFVLGGLYSLVTLRFFFGAGEAGAYPNITRAIHNWFPVSHWELAQSFIWMSGRLMGGLTPLLWAWLVAGTGSQNALLSWRGAFLLFGLVGVAWCIAFAALFRNRPSQNSRVNSEELQLIGSVAIVDSRHDSVPWSRLITNRSLWALCIMYSLINYGWAFNITYLPSYLQTRFGLAPDDVIGAIYKGAPLWVGAIGCIFGGLTARFLANRLGDRYRARKILGFTAMGGCALSWFGALYAPNIHVFCFCVSFAAFCIDSTLGACWASCQDLGRRHAAVTAACMNTIGTIGSAVAGWLTGTIVESAIRAVASEQGIVATELSEAAKQIASQQGFAFAFATYSGVYVLAALCWLLIDPRIPLDDRDRT